MRLNCVPKAPRLLSPPTTSRRSSMPLA
ncbi:hypothetical protein M0804_015448 [Polistes exclamans]|nr:hypothetical protein M0804_015448 [Polistes exclamans]